MTTLEVGQLEGTLTNLAARLDGDMREALDLCRPDIAHNFIDIFHRSQDAAGAAWPEHAPETVAAYGPHPLLILTTAMFQSVTTDMGTADSVIENDGRELEWGTSLEYAGYNNDGTARIPKREFMYWTEEAADNVVETLGKWIGDNLLAGL